MNAMSCDYRTHGNLEAGSARAKRPRPVARSGPEGAKRGWARRRNRAWDSLRSVTGFARGDTARAAKSPPLAAALGTLLFLGLSAPSSADAAVLVSNVGKDSSGTRDVGANDYAQAFDTGDNPGGYYLESIVLDFNAAPTGSATLTVTVRADSSSGPSATVLYTLTNPTLAAGLNEFEAPSNARLSANTTYHVVASYNADSGGPSWNRVLLNSGLDAGAASGWEIDAPYLIKDRDDAAGEWQEQSNQRAIKIQVKGNNAATGEPTIAGFAQVGNTLTAGTGMIADRDGLPATFDFQWVRVDGGTETDITGATSSTYTPVTADLSQTLKVKVSFTDRQSNEEMVTSAATAAVVEAPPACDADAHWCALLTVGLGKGPGDANWSGGYCHPASGRCTTMTAWGALNDDDFTWDSVDYTVESLRWGTGVSRNAHLTLNRDFPGTGLPRLTLEVDGHEFDLSDAGRGNNQDNVDNNYKWDVPAALKGYAAGRAVRVELFANTPATGVPVVMGRAQVGATLTASTASIQDADGLGTFSYQWSREDEDGSNPEEISGATSATYELVAADNEKRVRVKVSFTDGEGYAEELTSAAFPSQGTVAMAPPEMVDPTALWSATLTPVTLGSDVGCFSTGENDEDCSFSSVLSDDDFTFDSTTYSFSQIFLNSGTLTLVFDKSLPSAASGWEFTVTESGSTTTLDFSDDTDSDNDRVAFASTGLSWSAGDTISLAMSIPGTGDVTPPTLESSNISSTGDSLTLVFNENLDVPNPPPVSALVVKADGSQITATYDGIVLREYYLTLSPVVGKGRTVTVSYFDPTSANDPNALQDAAGNDVATFENVSVTNNSEANNPATGAPGISGTPQVGHELTASTGDIMDLDGLMGATYVYQWVRVDADGTSNPTNIGGATSSTYTLATADQGKTIKVKVTFQDEEGNDEALTSDAYPPGTDTVTADTTRPTLSTATVNDDSLVLTYSENLDTNSTPASTAFAVTVAGSARSLATTNPVTVSGDTVTLTLASDVMEGETVTVSYTVPGTNPIQDPQGNDAAALTNEAVTNLTIALPDITIEADRPTATGANDVIRYTLERDGPTTSALTVTVTLAAPAGNDWGLDSDDLNPDVTFGAGADTEVLVVSLAPTGFANIGFDNDAGFDGPLTATLGAVAGYDTTDTAVVDIVAVPAPRWFARLVGHPYRFTEDGGSQEVEVEVYAADPAMPAPSFLPSGTGASVEVGVTAFLPGTATVYDINTMVGDYVLPSAGRTQFPPSVFSVGEGRVQRGRVRIPIEILQDTLIEGDETFSVDLSNSPLMPLRAVRYVDPGGTPRDGSASYPHVVTIVDDDFGVTGVALTSTPGVSADTYGVGDEIRFTVTFNKAATVTGTPTLTFRMGASGSEADRTASYQSGSGTNELVFSYTVAAADSDSDGVSVLAGTTTNNTFSFPTGAHIRYGATDAVLLHDALAADSGHKVDGTMSPAGAPTAPTKLTATAVGANRIDLEWNTPSSMGGSDIEGYKIEWSADGNAPWTEETANTGNTDTTYSDTGLASATTRHYRVSAINDTLTGPVSNVAHATTEAGVPGTPTALSATARDADPTDGETEIELSWTEPGEMGDSDISGYRIEYSADGNEPWMELEATTGSTATTYIDDELPSETTRHYRVSAVNDQGAGGPSNTDSATTDDIAGPVLLSAGTDHGQLTLRFDEELDTASANAPPKSAFTVTADGVPLDFGTVEALTAPDAYLVTLAGLSPQVRRGQTAVVTYTDPSANDDTAAIQDDDGNDAASFTTGSDDIPAVTNSSTLDPVVPGKVPSLTAEAGTDGTSIVLSWERPADNGGRVISSYRIEVCETSCDQDASWTAAVETHDEMENGAIVLSYEHTVPAGATREYRVAARNSVDLGAWSDPPTIGQAVHPGAPGKPTGLTAEGRLPTTPNGTTLVKLSWDAPSDIGESEITGYRVEFSETIDPPSWEHVFTTRSTSTIHSPLPSEATRHYRVFAINDQGRSLPSDVVTETTPDIAAPVPESASVPTAGTSVVITFDEALDETTANLPQRERFTLTSADGAVFIPASVAVSGKTATVWLDGTSALIRTGQTLTLAYTDHTTGDDARGVVQDDDGNDAAAFTVGAGETVTITNGSTQPVTEPGEPRNVRAESGGEDRIVITWDAPIETGGRDITGYEVFVGPDDGNVTTSLVSGHTTKNSAGRFEYVHDGLSVGDQRWYTVHATNSGGHVGAGSPPVLGTVDKKGDVELSVDAASVAEGGTVTWTVTATTDEGEAPGSGLPMQVTVTSADGTATAPDDYASVDETVTITAGDFTQTTIDGATAYVATKTGTIAIVNDVVVEGEQGFTVAMEVASGGTGWVTGTDEVEVAIEDSDAWSVAVEASPAAIVEGETREIRLTARIMHVEAGGTPSVPESGTCVLPFDVRVGLEVGGTATGEGTDYTLEGSTPEREIEACAAAAEWRVTLTALVDTVDDDAETVTFTPVIGGSPVIEPVSLDASSVTIGEEPGVVLGVAALGVEEGESASYTVILTSRPSGTVTITPSVMGDMDVTVSPSSIRFDGDNWSLPQSVTVRAAHDEDDEDDAATVSHQISGADYGAVTVGSVGVNVRDDDKSFGELRVHLTGGRDGGRSSPVPTIHHGETFRIGLVWSETRTWPWAEPHRAVGADRAIRVTGGTVKPVVTPGYNAWTQHVLILEFTPDSAGSDVTLVLEPLDCSSPDPQRPNPRALCARLNNGNGAITGLAERVRYTVHGIDSVPAAPTNLLIEAEDQLAGDGVTVTGTALFAVFDPPAPGAERWRVEAQAAGGGWSGPRVWRGDRRGTRYPYRARMGGLAADGAWEIRARWENRYGAGPWAEAETTDAPALAAPRNVQVAQGAQGRSASLTWSPPAGSSGQVARYQYRLGWDAASWAEGWRAIPDSGPGAANEASYTVHGVEQSWSVEASIRAVDRSGRAGTPSAVVRVPAAAPTVLEGGVRVTSDPGRDGRYAIGDAIDVGVRMSRPVVLEGAGTGFNFDRQRGEWIHEAGIDSGSGPTVTLEIGDRRPAARLVRIGGVAGADVPGSVSGDTLHFRYTVQGNDEDMDGIRIPSGGLSLNGSELVDANDADTAARFSLGEAIAFPGHLVQGVPAQVEKIERVGHQVWVYFTQDLTPVTLVPHLRNGAIGDQFRVEFPSSGSSGGDVTDARIVRGRGWGSNCRRGETGCKAVRLTTRSRARADETMTIAYVPNAHHPKYRLRDLAGNEAKAFGRTTAVPLGAGDSPVMSVSDAEGYEQIAHLRTLHFNVKLIPAATREVTVRYTTQDGRVDGDQLAARGYLSATENVDYRKESGTLVFRPGDTGHPVRVEIIDDGIEDGGEVFALVLSDLTGPATFGDSVGQGLIHNHEVLTATFEEVPEDHDGASAFSLELAFNEPVTADADTVKGALTVTGGEATTVTAVGTDAKRFELTVTPAGTDAVTVAIGPELDCTATNAVCTAEDIGLERRFEATIAHDGSAALAAPTVAGVPQVGATLEASFAETPGGTLTWQWLRGEEEIAGADAATYAPVAADVGSQLAVRVSRGEETAVSAPTAPVWPAPANPALAPGEEELLSTTLTLGASDEFPLRMGGYNRFVGGPFGEMDETSFDEGARRHVVEMVMLNELGRFVLATQGPLPPAAGLVVYWNAHRINGLEAKQAVPGRDMLAGPSGIPRETYLALADGTAEGVKVAVSVRRTHAVVSVTGASVTSGPGDNGTWDEDETIDAQVRFSAPVTVSGGPPTLAVMLDGNRREAAYSSGSGTDTLTFAWTVTEADAGAKRARVASNGLALNGATLSAGSNTVVDIGFAVAPWVTTVAIAPDASGDREWTEGEIIEAELTFSEPVTVADASPWIEIRIGGFAHPGTLGYASGSGSATLVFSTEVPAGANGFTGLAVVADSLEANGVSIVSAASGLAAELGHDGTEPTAAPGESGATEPLTAAFHDVPQSHDGTAFTLELRFGEPVPSGAAAPGAFIATGATVGAVSAQDDRTWSVTVTPDGAASAVTVTLPARDCTETGAVCTADGRGLESDVSASVAALPGETPFRVALEGLPEEHDGASDIVFRVVFNKRPAGFSYTVLRDQTLDIRQGGTRLTPAVRRVLSGEDRNTEWRVTVTPDGKEDVTVAIGPFSQCSDAGAICTESQEVVSNDIDETILGPPGLTVDDARVYEAPGATVDFVVRLGRASRSTVHVDYATSDGTRENAATAGEDYAEKSGTLAFAPGETEHTVSVLVYQDGHDEGEETFTLTLSNPQGGNAWLADATATGTIENSDAMPRAWLARFGRTVAEQMVDAVDARFAAGRTAGVEMTLAGQPLAGASPEEIEALEEREAEKRLEAFAERLKGVTGEDDEAGNDERALTGRDFLTASAFTLTAGTAEGGYGAVWGRGAASRFDGREGELSLEGEVTSVMLGADFTRDAGTLGLALTHSRGEGSYQGEGEGEVSSTLTGLYPYGRWEVSPRVSVWGVAGYGAGALTLTPEGQDPLETDMNLMMGAVGARAVALEAPAEGGVELSVTSDAMAVRTRSEAETGERGNLAEAQADVTRLRLGLEGTWRGVGTDGGATFVPTFEVGVRHDAGDAETGFGLDVGGGLAWAHPRVGLSADVRARALLTHESDGFGERGLSGSLGFDPRPGSDRGFAMTLTQTMGAQASGGMDALLGHRHLEGLGAGDEGGLEGRRLELRAGYGFAVFGDRFTAKPEAGLGLSNGHRELSLGWRLGLARSGPVTMELGLEATRREAANDDGPAPVNALMLRGTLRW